jgi:hypothetical protein
MTDEQTDTLEGLALTLEWQAGLVGEAIKRLRTEHGVPALAEVVVAFKHAKTICEMVASTLDDMTRKAPND